MTQAEINEARSHDPRNQPRQPLTQTQLGVSLIVAGVAILAVCALVGEICGGGGVASMGAGATALTGVEAVVADEGAAGAIDAAVNGGLDMASARFAQKTFGEAFSTEGDALFPGRTIDGIVSDLRSGAMAPGEVPINVVVRDGNTLILNTRSAQALTRAGVPRDAWNVINRTGDPLYEGLLNGQLTRNGLDSGGFLNPRSTG